MKVLFPKQWHQKYYQYHYNFLLNVLRTANVDVELGPNTAVDDVRFTIEVDGKKFLVDFSDHTEIYNPQHLPVFKYHYTEGLHEPFENVYPFSPISFIDWNNYCSNRRKYTCNNDRILFNQRPICNARARRLYVKAELQIHYLATLDTKITDQKEYWDKINNCLVGVFAPGARNDMLDRAQFQFMAFGVCTISPYLKTMPLGRRLIPGEHYIECKPDYSDLIQKIEWCKKNREQCVQIGKNAQVFFGAYCVPGALARWIQKCRQK